MENKTAIDILKEAILLEKRGKAFYSNVAEKSDSEAAKKVFSMMAEEEDEHIKFLSRQFSHYVKTNEFLKNDTTHGDTHDEVALKVLTDDIKKQITAASFEAAAISAAMDFENRAVKIYSERAETATDINEKELYKMLADWEQGHSQLLHKLNEELKEEIWYDNNFWPF
ncbi:MAG: ferritin family protein [Bacteroidetes bacterium]|nr:ferritin family protein [Bacteroidota bacterium]